METSQIVQVDVYSDHFLLVPCLLTIVVCLNPSKWPHLPCTSEVPIIWNLDLQKFIDRLQFRKGNFHFKLQRLNMKKKNDQKCVPLLRIHVSCFQICQQQKHISGASFLKDREHVELNSRSDAPGNQSGLLEIISCRLSPTRSNIISRFWGSLFLPTPHDELPRTSFGQDSSRGGRLVTTGHVDCSG